MSPAVRLIIPLAQAHRSPKSGQKAANLSKLIAAGFDVPRGFVIACDAYQWHLWASGEPCGPAGELEAEEREAVRAAMLGQSIAEDVRSAIAEAYRELGLHCGIEQPKVAVRSSALHDFPGAHESYLNVKGLEELETAVKRVWASVWNGRAAAFRTRLRQRGEPAMAVIVQEMIDRRLSGSATTANPITGNPNRVLVSCESKSGSMRHFELDLNAPPKPSATEQGDGADWPALLVAERAVLIEEVLGSRVEVEWAHDGKRLWILQAQPLAHLPTYFPVKWPAENDAKLEWHRAASQPVTPMSCSLLWESARGRSRQSAFIREKQGRRLINGYAYRFRARIDVADAQDDAARSQAREIAQGLRLLEKWRRELAPSVRDVSARIVGLQLSEMGRPALLRALAAAADAWRRAVDLLDQSSYPSARFPKLLRDFVGSGTDGRCLYQRLISDAAGPVVMRDARLQDLGDRLAAAKRSGLLDDGKWWSGFKHEVESFAREYGYAFADLGEAYDVASWRSWVEDTEPLFRMIGALARRGKRPSLVTLHNAREVSAKLAEEEADEIYEGKAGAHFRSLLDVARGWLAMRSEAESICALACTALRLTLVEFGRRLVASGVLRNEEDVFYLRVEEIFSLPAKPNGSQTAKTAAVVARRKHELWLQRRLAAPDLLPVEGDAQQSARPAQALTIRGRAVSPGTATGRARVARTVAEAGEVESGEILVVRSPSLAWTPFLGVASALVCEEAGDLSIAPIALSYDIPAAVGCSGAMSAFRPGTRITIDSSAGVVACARRAHAASPEGAESGRQSRLHAFSPKTRKSAG